MKKVEGKDMKLLVVGSRSIETFDLTPFIPADTDLIITGSDIYPSRYFTRTEHPGQSPYKRGQ